MDKHFNFRLDINGLRAWAALAVLFFHFNILHFSGGFVGVDIFFVISGYLMAMILYPQIVENRKINLFHFYVRRFKRVAPALFVLLLVILLLSCYLIIVIDISSVLNEIKNSAIFIYNITSSRVDYFSTNVNERWLMHTWTLGVEFQFYLLFPILLLLLKNCSSKKIIFYLSVIAGLSFLMMLSGSSGQQNNVFFLLPYRLWEFLLGSVVFLFQYNGNINVKNVYRKSIGYLSWITLILFFLFYEKKIWPNWHTFIPVSVTSLILFSNLNTLFTRNILVQKLGDASYSIYLWHWPIYVLCVLFEYNSFCELLIASCVSILIGFISYYFIEKPVKNWNASLQKQGCILLGMSIYLYCLVSVLEKKESLLFNHFFINSKYQNVIPYMDFPTDSALACTQQTSFCQFGDEKSSPKFILIGDSHAVALIPGLEELANKYQSSFLSSALLGCPMIFNIKNKEHSLQKCLERNNNILSLLDKYPNIPVVIVNRYNEYLLGHNEDEFIPSYYLETELDMSNAHTLKKVREELGAGFLDSVCKVSEKNMTYLVNSIPEIGKNVPMLIAKNMFIKNERVEITLDKQSYFERNQLAFQLLEKAKKDCGVKIIDVSTVLCDSDFCYTSNGKDIYYADDDHLNLWGSRKVSPLFEHLFIKADTSH
ncbi:acyltransferase family protein [Bisgaard Taxon 46]